jgi:hypothetical protein
MRLCGCGLSRGIVAVSAWEWEFYLAHDLSAPLMGRGDGLLEALKRSLSPHDY